jgi:hypothetical protein
MPLDLIVMGKLLRYLLSIKHLTCLDTVTDLNKVAVTGAVLPQVLLLAVVVLPVVATTGMPNLSTAMEDLEISVPITMVALEEELAVLDLPVVVKAKAQVMVAG